MPSVVARCRAMTRVASIGRVQLRQPGLAGRCDGKAGHDCNNAIELESPQGARMHGDSGRKECCSNLTSRTELEGSVTDD